MRKCFLGLCALLLGGSMQASEMTVNEVNVNQESVPLDPDGPDDPDGGNNGPRRTRSRNTSILDLEGHTLLVCPLEVPATITLTDENGVVVAMYNVSPSSVEQEIQIPYDLEGTFRINIIIGGASYSGQIHL